MRARQKRRSQGEDARRKHPNADAVGECGDAGAQERLHHRDVPHLVAAQGVDQGQKRRIPAGREGIPGSEGTREQIARSQVVDRHVGEDELPRRMDDEVEPEAYGRREEEDPEGDPGSALGPFEFAREPAPDGLRPGGRSAFGEGLHAGSLRGPEGRLQPAHSAWAVWTWALSWARKASQERSVRRATRSWMSSVSAASPSAATRTGSGGAMPWPSRGTTTSGSMPVP